MKIIIVIMLISISTIGYGQVKCSCDSQTWMKESVSCKPTVLKNGSKFYYQFNCDSAWITLENIKHKKTILFSLRNELVGYTYRLGYQLIKEYKETLLFRYGCPANGPCSHVLINKTTGKKVKELNELIYGFDYAKTDFILYFTTEKRNSLTLYYINTGKHYRIPVSPKDFTGIVPEYQFDDPEFTKGMLILSYESSASKDVIKKKISINLTKFHK
jgi:hypothetical protein